MNIGYYPGCALHGSSNDYEQSLRACLGALDVQLEEIKDWICCGATAAHSLNHKLSLGASGAKPGGGGTGRLQAIVRALPAVLDAIAEGEEGGGGRTACARNFPKSWKPMSAARAKS